MNFELVVYQIDSEGRRTVERGSTTTLSASDLQGIADTLHGFATARGPLCVADDLESIIETL